MGYSTQFNLVTTPQLPFFYIDQWLATDEDGICNWEGKYYSHEELFIQLSTRNPDVVFTLTGCGEDPIDIWRKYFKNGKMQKWKLERDIDKLAEPFNPAKLK